MSGMREGEKGQPMTGTKQAIVINLNELRDLMREFADEHDPDGENLLAWTFSTFIQWLVIKKENEREQAQTTPSITSTGTH